MLVPSVIIIRYKTEKSELIIRLGKIDASRLVAMFDGKKENICMVAEVYS
jgi:hypothetical protein